MSYNNYNNPEYGGGGSSGQNYYDTTADFSDRPSRHDNPEYRDTRYTGPDYSSPDNEFSSAAHHAQQHHSEDSGLFSTALNFLSERKAQYADPGSYDVDEQHAVQSHQAMYGGDEQRTHDSGTVGAGAAMQALKMFTGGSGGESEGFDKNKLIGLAMAQAGKLWDEKAGSGANMVCFLGWLGGQFANWL